MLTAAAACSACPAVHTDRELPSGPSPGVAATFKLEAGGVDQVVVGQLLLFAGAWRVGVDDVHESPWPLRIPLGVKGDGFHLAELDLLAPVDRFGAGR